jgi:hypothetical protein
MAKAFWLPSSLPPGFFGAPAAIVRPAEPPPVPGTELMAPRPLLAESSARVAPMSESEQMWNIDRPEAEPANDVKVLYLLPSEARRRTFAMLQRHTTVMAEPGTEECEALMQRLAEAYSSPARRVGARPVMAGIEDEAMAMLRARCAVCPERCESPVE